MADKKINKKALEQLKRINGSKDAEKTKVRVKELWQGSSKNKRDAILDLSGVAKITIDRVCRTGSIQIKLVAAMSQILEVDPNVFNRRSGRTAPVQYCPCG